MPGLKELFRLGSIQPSLKQSRSRRTGVSVVRFSGAKSDFLAAASMASPDRFQHNWSRIILSDLEQLEGVEDAEATKSAAEVLTFMLTWFEEVREHKADASPSAADFTWLDRARRLDRLERTDAALDLLYDNVDEMLRQGRFAELGRFLDAIRTPGYSVDLLLGLLTATLPARSRLPARAAFFDRVRRTLQERNENEPGLLTGLE